MDFEKLMVYQKAKSFSINVWEKVLKKNKADHVLADQLRRSSTSIALNIAEGTSRFSKADRRHFYVVARGSAYESVAVLDLLKDTGFIDETLYENFELQATEISKMLFGLEKALQ